MARMPTMIKPSKAAPPATPTEMGPGGGTGPAAAPSMSQPKGPGGSGFLINPGAFSDSHAAGPPGARGMRKSAGYPSFTQNP